jgi:DNA polymerase-3 subunit alpha
MHDFVHLHLHTQYSLLDGAIRTSDLFPRLREHGVSAVACTDHGNMFGALDFYERAKKAGIQPIFGCEAYVSAGDHRDKTNRKTYHVILLAKDPEGFRNLNYLVSMGFLEGFYYHPRIDKEMLRAHSRGLFGLSACLGGEPSQHVLAGNAEAARQSVLEYKEIFDPGSYFLEVQSNGYAEQEVVNRAYRELSESCDVPLVATGDCHYLDREDARAHEILMCIQTGKTLDDARRLQHPSEALYIRSPQEMHHIFGEMGFARAVENTLRIASECKVELELGKLYLPKFPVPAGHTLESFLAEQATRGLERRFEELPPTVDHRTYRERLERELAIIQRMGFAGYFLIVWDFIRFAKDHGIPVGPGRGSGAGSLVAYSLRITDIDPIFYGLLFERFLNPERVSMPDFDVDFCMNRRDEVIEYVVEKYGRERVAQIAALGQLKARSVIKDVGRVLGLPFSETDRITKLIPPKVEGHDTTIDEALKLEPRLLEIQREKPEFAEILFIGRALEGLNRQAGVHAAGIVISEKPVWEHVPVCRVKENELVTQWNKDEVEKAGLVKFDFLGLKTLTVIDTAVRLVNRHAEPPLDIARVPLADPKVYKMLAGGETDGVFQMEGSGFTEMLKRLRPDRFTDLIAAVALYRPGPMESGMMDDYVNRKHGRAKITYPHPSCEPILRETYGVVVYQEQVMSIAVELCGFSMGHADLLRKAMGKKKPEEMAKQRAAFVQGAVAKSGMDSGAASALFDQVEKFAGYSFNKSHSAAYALLAYQTAYLKARHPVEFMAALLTCDQGDTDKVSHYIAVAKNLGIEVLPPDVNESDMDFSVIEGRIRFGLGAVRNVGEAAVSAILEERARGGRFADLSDFSRRVDLRRINKRVIESLVKGGAFDSTGARRSQVFAAIDRAVEAGQAAQKDRETGQRSLFGLGEPSPSSAVPGHQAYADLPEWPERERLAFEKESLGFYITGHPLRRFAGELQRYATCDSRSLAEKAHREVTLAGIVSGRRERVNKSGGRWAAVQLEDLYGGVEVLVFAKVYERAEAILKSDEPILVRGTVLLEGEDDNPVLKVRADEIQLLSDLRLRRTTKLAVRVGVVDATRERLERMRALCEQHRGTCDVYLCVSTTGAQAILRLPERLRVAASDDLVAGLLETFGPGTVELR